MANAIRVPAMDAVRQANSGRLDVPMGMADIAVALWSHHLRHSPLNPHWSDRDRFMLSNGHSSMLIYALLHLTGCDLPMSELENFHQLHSKTTGYPGHGITPGTGTIIGPLGQGITSAVGIALAERLLGQESNCPGLDVVNHRTYVFLGGGCLMKSTSHEACSLVDTLRPSRLITLQDDNGISINGDVIHWFNDDASKHFEAYGRNVIRAVDSHDVDAVDTVITEAKKSDRPTLACCRMLIGKGAPNREGSHDVYGTPLGDVEIAAARGVLAWPHTPFEVPQAVYDVWGVKGQGQALEKVWNALFDAYSNHYPAKAEQLEYRMHGELPAGFEKAIDEFVGKCELKAGTIATRKVDQNTPEAYAPVLGELLGGSADLTGLNLTNQNGSKTMCVDAWGNHINYGVHRFGMNAIMNGIALHGGCIPYGGTFPTLSNYSHSALRMAALMKVRSIFVFTHGSIGLGEDGPTHQSVEHVTGLRLIPNMDVWRTAGTTETAIIWAAAIERQNGPSCLIFSRQSLPFQTRNLVTREVIARGDYVLHDAANGKPGVIIIATGLGVGLVAGAADQFTAEGIRACVVPVSVTTVFDKQDSAHEVSVLPTGIPRIVVETGVTNFWWRYQVRTVAGIDTFGESAPAGMLLRRFGFTVKNVANTAKSVIT